MIVAWDEEAWNQYLYLQKENRLDIILCGGHYSDK